MRRLRTLKYGSASSDGLILCACAKANIPATSAPARDAVALSAFSAVIATLMSSSGSKPSHAWTTVSDVCFVNFTLFSCASNVLNVGRFLQHVVTLLSVSSIASKCPASRS